MQLVPLHPGAAASSTTSGGGAEDAAEAGGMRGDQGCGGEAAGWYAPLANPRAVVYLAFVVGLGFSWTENIQYGAQVYQSAALWNGHNVTVGFGTFHVTLQSKHQLTTAAIVYVTNLTPPGSDNPTRRRRRTSP
jgi:hypothetical protein